MKEKVEKSTNTSQYNITVYIGKEIFAKKEKALFMLKKEGLNFSKAVANLIEEYAKRHNCRGKYKV